MRKADREKQKMDAKREKQRMDSMERKAKTLGIKTKGLKKYVLQLSCGCCDADAWFASEDRLKSQFVAAGLTVDAAIRDDIGQDITGVDTFFGYRQEKDARRGLDYLINRIAAGQ